MFSCPCLLLDLTPQTQRAISVHATQEANMQMATAVQQTPVQIKLESTKAPVHAQTKQPLPRSCWLVTDIVGLGTSWHQAPDFP